MYHDMQCAALIPQRCEAVSSHSHATDPKSRCPSQGRALVLNRDVYELLATMQLALYIRHIITNE